MEQILSLLTFFCVMYPISSLGLPHHMDQKRQVSGVVKDYDKKRGIIVLENFTDWDREQISFGLVGNKTARRTFRWLQGLPKNQAAIWVNVADMKEIRRGVSITITDYHYIADEFTIYPKYAKLTIGDKK